MRSDTITAKPGEAAARAGAAARAAAMGNLAVDAKNGWQLAKAALHGNAADEAR